MYECMVIIYSISKVQPGEVANPARGQLNRENQFYPRSRLRIWSRETDSAIPSRVSLLISVLRLNLVLSFGVPPEFAVAFIYVFKPPYAIGPVPSLSSYAIAYRWRSLPRVRPVNLKVAPNGCCLGRLPWTN